MSGAPGLFAVTMPKLHPRTALWPIQSDPLHPRPIGDREWWRWTAYEAKRFGVVYPEGVPM